MIFAIIAANVFGWLVLQLAIAAVATRMDSRRFAHDNWLYRTCPAEVAFYRNWLLVRRWKGLLPDGAPWVGGTFRKKRIQGRDPAYLRQFVIETRRGEAAHWVMLACFPLFFAWNPHWAWIVMALYAIAANLPCIVVQRYNRHAVQGLLAHQK
jgi:glycosyl-4,4'-diaponeurosporenoate acyltransferase